MPGVKVKDLVRIVNAAATFEAAGFRSHVATGHIKGTPPPPMGELGTQFKDFIRSKSDHEAAALALALDKLITGAHGLADAEVGLGAEKVVEPSGTDSGGTRGEHGQGQ